MSDQTPTDFIYYLHTDEEIRDHIQQCEGKHIQQVAFSTYMDTITQICFTERVIRSGIEVEGSVNLVPVYPKEEA